MYKPPPPPSFTAFSLRSNGGRFNRIITDVGLSVPYDPASGSPQPEVYATKALWDTGATHSVITKTVARALNLVPTSKTRMNHAGGVSDVNGYVVSIYLPNHMNIRAVEVLEMEDQPECGMLLGMDVITMGDFAVTNVQGNTLVSFRFPSVAEIDYVIESNRLNSAVKQSAGIGRNEPCPCGSGRKYKNCHGR